MLWLPCVPLGLHLGVRLVGRLCGQRLALSASCGRKQCGR